MARIKGRNRADTQRAVLAAAEWAFARFGFRGASMQVIAKRAEVTPATLCYYFTDKAGLFDGVVDAIYQRAGTLTAELKADATVEELIAVVYDFAEINRDALRVILGHIVEEGGLDATTRDVRMTGSLGLIVPIVSARFQLEPKRAREALVSLNHLIMRFVTNTPEDNRVALGAANDEEAREQILALLTSIARHLLNLPPAKAA